MAKDKPNTLVIWGDDIGITNLSCYNDGLMGWKCVFMEQRQQGTLEIWFEPFVALRVPKMFNLRMDPFERADGTSNTYWDWYLDNLYLPIAATAVVTEFLHTFVEFPPRQKAASFTIDQVVAKLEAVITSGH